MISLQILKTLIILKIKYSEIYHELLLVVVSKQGIKDNLIY